MESDPKLEEAIAQYRTAMAEQTERMVELMRRCWGNPQAFAEALTAEMARAELLTADRKEPH